MSRFNVLTLGLAGSLFFIAPVNAQDDNSDDRVAQLIERIQSRPIEQDRTTWKQERRDAARALGETNDPRAVAPLIQLVRDEPFDIVGEIAIASLGNLGDPKAIPVLQEVAEDASRTRQARRAAQRALQKLGAQSESDDSEEDTTRLALTGLVGNTPPKNVELAADFGDDLLAASDSLRLVVGSGHIAYDTASKTGSFDGQGGVRYNRTREHTRLGLRSLGQGDVVMGLVDYDAANTRSRLIAVRASALIEARLYPDGGKWFALAGASTVVGFDHVKVNQGAPSPSETFLSAELGLNLGGGHGRVLNVGEKLRVKRIEQLLAARKLLGRPITGDVSERVMRAWWKLRSRIGYHDHLVATVTILREAGVLLEAPDAGTSYAITQILRDGQLSERLSGLQWYVALGESLRLRDEDLGVRDGRIESAVGRVEYGRQDEDGDSEITVLGQGRYELFGVQADPTPWAINVSSHWRDFYYNENEDPLGALDIGAQAGLSADGLQDSEIASRLGGSVGWVWTRTRANRIRLSGQVRYESGEFFFGATLEGQIGVLQSGYVGKSVTE